MTNGLPGSDALSALVQIPMSLMNLSLKQANEVISTMNAAGSQMVSAMGAPALPGLPALPTSLAGLPALPGLGGAGTTTAGAATAQAAFSQMALGVKTPPRLII